MSASTSDQLERSGTTTEYEAAGNGARRLDVPVADRRQPASWGIMPDFRLGCVQEPLRKHRDRFLRHCARAPRDATRHCETMGTGE